MRALVLLTLALSLTGCLGKINWPKVVECAASAEPALVVAVTGALDGKGDIVSELADIARRFGPEAVVCAVKQIAGDLASASADVKAGHRAERAREFLGRVQQ